MSGGEGEALAAAELDRRFSPPCRQRRDLEAVDLHGPGVGELADFGDDLEIDEIVLQHRWRERKADAELLEGDGDCHRAAGLPGLRCRDREFAAGEEIRALAGNLFLLTIRPPA